MNLILRKEHLFLGRIGLYFGGFGEKLNYFQGFEEQRQTTLREQRKIFSRIWGDQCIIFRDQGSTDPLGPLTWRFTGEPILNDLKLNAGLVDL